MKNTIILFLFILLTSSVFAQTINDPVSDSAKIVSLKKANSPQKQKNNFAPFGGSNLSNVLSNVSLSSTLNTGQNGKVELAYTTKKYWTFGISADQKIGKNDSVATPFDLNGLSNGTTVGFNIQKMFWKPKMSTKDFSLFIKIKEEYAKTKGVDARTVTFNDIKDGGTKEQKKQLKHIYLKQPFVINVKGSFTKTQFNYATDSVSLAQISNSYITPNASISLIKFITNGFLSVNYTYSEYYKASDNVDFYSPFGTSGNYYSQSVIFGEPTKESDNKVNVEFKKSFYNKNEKMSFAIDPSVLYAINTKKVAVYLPVYFINGLDNKGKPNGLQGGINFGYLTSTNQISSFKDGFGAQLIVTLPFDVFEGIND